eukprot:PhM_4_TR8301/c2_g2_i7/m.24953
MLLWKVKKIKKLTFTFTFTCGKKKAGNHISGQVKCVAFAKAVLEEQKRIGGTFFRRLVFSDEAYIAVGDASTHAWMWSHEFIPRLCTAHPASIMLWAGISELGAT